ncbi:variable surface lipoprotein [Mycoplasmopsis bovis]|uniref:variable surface lipoprotein n=1 Tax=Mycoplasmopsis bovis TaxID=28903 RepID=UPI002611BF49|nr:variable surface lipoprotein [Mycoplasmopsis bovis]
MKKSKFLLLGSVASLASIPFVAAKCGETKEEKKPEVDKPKLSETLKSITGNDLGKVQVAEQDKSNKEKIEASIKETIILKVPALAGKYLQFKTDLTKNEVNVSSNDFQGEVVLKFEVEVKSSEKQKLEDALKSISGKNLGKVQVSKETEKKDKAKIEASIKETIILKVPALAGKDLQFKTDLTKNEVNVSSNDFQGEVVLKFEVEVKSSEKQKLEDALKSISGKNLGKVQVSKETEKKDKAKIEASIKETIILKVPALAGKDLQFKTDLTKNEVNVSSNDFQGEVVLKFEVEVKSSEKQKLEDALKSISGKNLGKVQVSKETEKKDKAKIEASIKETIILKVPALAGKDLQFKTDLTKNEVNVSSNDFQGEVVLKFEVEVKSSEKQKLEDALKSISGKNLGKVQVSKETEKKDKAKIEASIKETIILKVPALAGKDLQFKTDLTKNEVNVSSNDFQGEVVLKFEVEVKSK